MGLNTADFEPWLKDRQKRTVRECHITYSETIVEEKELVLYIVFK